MKLRAIIKAAKIVGIVLFGLVLTALADLVLFFAVVQLYQNTRFEMTSGDLCEVVEKPVPLREFEILDPYDHPGVYRKAQLHTHTSNSIDVWEKVPVELTLQRYKNAGYSFVVLADHDRVTVCTELDGPDFLAIPGEEDTVPFVYPFGKHLLRIGVDTPMGGASLRERIDSTSEQGGLVAPAHLNWRGGAGTGRWYWHDLQRMDGCKLIEIYNVRSNKAIDIWLWHKLLVYRGYSDPVWGIAVDDTDNGVNLDRGWVMVKTEEVSRESLLRALARGSFYATTGPEVRFSAANGRITAAADRSGWIRFFDQQNKVVAVVRAASGEYSPTGAEGFVRVEIATEDGIAWSQPFFLKPLTGGGSRD